MSQTTSTKGPFWYHHDGLGSVTDITSASGSSLWWTEYTPFGAPRASASTSQAPVNLVRFSGAYLDLASGLDHLRARQYDPSLGRFLSTDPLAGPITDPYVGAYVYVGDNPVNRVDPSGLESQSPSSAESAAATRCAAAHFVTAAVEIAAFEGEAALLQGHLAAGPFGPVQAALLVGDAAFLLTQVGVFIIVSSACGA